MQAGSFALVGVLAALTMAMTPSGLSPASSENMVVSFDSLLATNGINVPITTAATAPTLALDKSLNGTFLVIMTDPDAGGNGNGSSAFLHWMQDGLSTAKTSTLIGNQTAFSLEIPSNVSAIQPYKAPGPPAGQTHRYTQYLVDTTGVTGFPVSDDVAQQVSTRQNFDMQSFISQAKLKIASANFFNVTGT